MNLPSTTFGSKPRGSLQHSADRGLDGGRFLAPIGYLKARRAMGKSLMADPERAPLVGRAFEEYATGRYTKEQLLEPARAWGLTNRRGRPLTS
jgi:hypothetical protein